MFFCKFRITGESLIPDEITQVLDIVPDKSYKKDEIKELNNEKITYIEGCWMKNFETDDYDHFQDLILEFLQPFILKKEQIINLRKQFSITLWISLYPDNNQISFHIPSALIEEVSKLGISLDITTIYLENFYNY